jgi:hypothetical protein
MFSGASVASTSHVSASAMFLLPIVGNRKEPGGGGLR